MSCFLLPAVAVVDDCCFDLDFFGFAPAAVASDVGDALNVASSEEVRFQK
jgi:hypothetical protein